MSPLGEPPHTRRRLIYNRDDIRTNLLDSYDRINAFGQKHLPDPFYTEGVQRVSVRDIILREIASNVLIHREYMNPFPAKIIIDQQRIYAENSNNPHGYGSINPNNFSPFPKNPIIARFFKEIGYADELGSGVRNLYKYNRIYSNSNPQLIEEDVFKIIVPLTTQAETVTETEQLNSLQKQLILAIKGNPNITWKEMINLTGKSRATIGRHISILKKMKKIQRKGSDKKGKWVLLDDNTDQ